MKRQAVPALGKRSGPCDATRLSIFGCLHWLRPTRAGHRLASWTTHSANDIGHTRWLTKDGHGSDSEHRIRPAHLRLIHRDLRRTFGQERPAETQTGLRALINPYLIRLDRFWSDSKIAAGM